MKISRRNNVPIGASLMIALVAIFQAPTSRAAEPIRLHPQNGHYFLFRDKPEVLIGSSEHYGALVNLDFDYVRYLSATSSAGLNLVRVFSGTYREMHGAFNIQHNTLAPSTARSIAPWKRTATTGAADGGNKFDLNQWNPTYFSRLRDFVNQASQRGIVVELTLFSAFYNDALWNLSPMNASNHINGVGGGGRLSCYNATGNLVPFQKALARKCATELAGFDNVIFEICNEPYSNNITQTWQNAIIAELVAAEANLPKRHMIAQNVHNYKGAISSPNTAVSLFNFHYAVPEAAVHNYGLNRALGDDETGFAGQTDFPYRREAWEFMLSGGGLFNLLDYSYTATNESGTATQSAPGGGGPSIRKQLSVLRNFLKDLPLVDLVPLPGFLAGGLPSGAAARIMGQPGVAYGLYLRGGSKASLKVNLPAGRYVGKWIDTKTGSTALSISEFIHPGGQKTLVSPTYSQDIALKISKVASLKTAQILVNGDFKSNYTGWVHTGHQSIQTSEPSKTKHVSFNSANSLPNGVLSQTFPTTQGFSYELRFDLGIIAFNSLAQHLQVAVTGKTTLLSQVLTLTGTGSGIPSWTQRDFTFVADGSTTTLTFRDKSTSTNNIDLLLANVHVGAISQPSKPTIIGTPGNFTLSITATKAGSYVLERSVDLAKWEQIDEITMDAPGPVVFNDTQAPPVPHVATFYRIGYQP